MSSSPPASQEQGSGLTGVLRSYFRIHARTTRMEFLLQYLIVVAMVIAIKLIAMQLLNDPSRLPGSMLFPPVDVALFFLYVGLTAFPVIRRAHDVGMGGMYVVLTIIPVVNLVALAVLFFRKGSERENAWGPAGGSGSFEDLAGEDSSEIAAG